MRKTKTLLLSAFIVIAWALPAAASTYHSFLGYSIDLPAGWKIINHKEVSSNSKMLETVFHSAEQGALKGADKDFMVSIRHMVSSGGVEYFVNKTYPGMIIGVNAIRGQIPQTSAALRESCRAAPAELTRYAGKPMRVYRCKAESLGQLTSLYLVTSGFAEGSRSIEYEIQKAPDQVLVFTATCQSRNFPATNETFHQLMKTVRID